MILFHDKRKEREFNRNGYVRLNVLENQDIEKLKEIYTSHEHHFVAIKKETFSSCDTLNQGLVNQLNRSISEILVPRLEGVFTSYDYLLSSFLIKRPGIDNMTGYHQDPTMVDIADTKVVSAGLWCPLQPTSRMNGCLRMIRGSHKFGKVLSVTPKFPTTFNRFEAKLDRFSDIIDLKLGQAVLFDNKTIHGAFSNHSESSRIAVVTAIKSKNSAWVYYHCDDNNSMLVSKYQMNLELYSSHECGQRPKGKMIEQFHYDFEEHSYHEFLKYLVRTYPIYAFRKIIRTL